MIPLARSRNMSRIRGTNTKPEVVFRKALWKRGLRYRLNNKIAGVRPDLVFPARKLAIFIDGCFWHGCPKHYVRPRSRSEFWARKLSNNTSRDRRQTHLLLGLGWTVLRFWEHEVKEDLPKIVEKVLSVYETFQETGFSRSITVSVATQSDDSEVWQIEDLLDPGIVRSESRTRPQTRR